MKNHLQGVSFIVIAAFGFGAMGIIATVGYEQGLTTNTLLSFRFGLAALIMWAFILIRKLPFRVTSRLILLYAVLGVFGYATMSTLLYRAFELVSPTIAVLIFYSYPMLVLIFALIKGMEKVTRSHAISLLMAGAGLILVLQANGSVHLLGCLYAFLAAIIYAAFIIISNRKISNKDSIVNSAYISVFASFALFLEGFRSNSIQLPDGIIKWEVILSLAVISTVVPLILFYKGMKILGPSRASIISIAEPVFAVILTGAVLHDHINISQQVGMLLVLCSSLCVSLNNEEIATVFSNINRRKQPKISR